MEALTAGEGDAFGRGEGHLGGGVKFNLRADGLGEADESEVLDDERVNLRCGSEAEESFRLGKFRGEDKNIHGEVASSAPGVEVIHDLSEVLFPEVFGPEPGVEGGESEIDGISPCGDGGFETFPVTRRRQKFWSYDSHLFPTLP
jgi:hypothetical protein